MIAVIALILLALVLAGAGTVSFVLPPLVCLMAAMFLVCRFKFRLDALSVLLVSVLAFVLFTLVPFPSAIYYGMRGRVFDRALSAVETSRRVAPKVVNESGAEGALEGEEKGAGEFASAWRPMTLNVAGTARFAAMSALSVGLFLWGRGSSVKRRRRLIQCGVFVAVGVAVCGLIGRYVIPQGKTLLWWISVRHGQPMGPFVNRNHFALLCAMSAPLALSLVVQPQLRMGGESESESTVTKRSGFGFLNVVYLVCFLVLIAGAFHSLSRSGSLAVLSGVFVTALLWVRSRPVAAAVAVVLGVVAMTAFVLLSYGGIDERRETLRNPLKTASAQHRLSMWGSALRIWRDFPGIGVGAEGFRAVYPAYKRNTSRKSALQAENEYVQVLAEGGTLGAVLFLAFWLLFFRALFRCHWREAKSELLSGIGRGARRWRGESPETVSPGLFYAVCGVVVCALVHCVFEFGFRIPLNAAVVSLVLGVSVPISDSARAEMGSEGRRILGFLMAPAVAVALLVAMMTVWLDVDRLDKDWGVRSAPVSAVERAVWWAPMHWLPWFALSQRHLEQGRFILNETGVASPQALDFAVYCAEVAVEFNRNDYRLWVALVDLYRRVGLYEKSVEAARRVVELRPYLHHEMKPYLERDDAPSVWQEF